MATQKLLISTIGLAFALAAPNSAMADDPWNNKDWDDDKDKDWDDDEDDDKDWDKNKDKDWDDGKAWGGKNKDLKLRQLQVNDKGVRLVVRGALERLKKKKKSNKPAKVVVKARGDATAVCINPSGKIPPNKNPVDADEVVLTGRAQVDLDDYKKGVVDFKVSTDRPELKVRGAPDCPNSKWTERIFDVAFTEVDITIVQDGKKLLDLECFFDGPTDDGKVPRKQLDCNER